MNNAHSPVSNASILHLSGRRYGFMKKYIFLTITSFAMTSYGAIPDIASCVFILCDYE
jgi:hypothetical protein